MPLRVRYDSDDVWLFDHLLLSDEFRLALTTVGVIMGKDLLLPDLLLVGYQRFQDNPTAYLNAEIPIVLYGSYDFGSVQHSFRAALDHDRVRGLIQWSSLASVVEHNAPVKDGYRHGALIAGNGDRPVTLTRRAYDKIKVWAGFATCAAFNPHFANIPLTAAVRPIGLHAVMNTAYKSHYIVQHRIKALNAVRDYMQQDYTTVLVGRSTGDKRSMSMVDYSQTMQQSEIVLSPWGWGEFCIRDYEAVMAGCVVIKPDTGFSQTWPLFNPHEHYIPCSPSFSDLGYCIEVARKRVADVEWRRNVREHVKVAGDLQLLAQRFKDCLE